MMAEVQSEEAQFLVQRQGLLAELQRVHGAEEEVLLVRYSVGRLAVQGDLPLKGNISVRSTRWKDCKGDVAYI